MKSKFNFTDKAIVKLPPHDTQSKSRSKEYRDLVALGLVLAVYKSINSRPPQKVFYYRGTLKGQKICKRLGDASILSVEEARTLAAECRAAIERGQDPRVEAEPVNEIGKLTLEKFVTDFYLGWAEQAKRSHEADKSKLKHHLLPRWGQVELAAITKGDIEMLLLEMSSKGYKPATINRMHSCVSTILIKAMDFGFLEKNVARNIKRRHENNQVTTHLKKDEVVRLFDALEKDPNEVAKNAIQMMALTGGRTSEVLKCRWCCFDEANATLRLEETKSGKTQYLFLSDAAMLIMQDMKRISHGRSEYIFPGKDPRKPYNNIKKPLTRALKAAGLHHLTPHCLRHTYASLLVAEGVSLYLVQKLLRHSSPVMSQRYSHLSPDVLKATSQIVSALVTNKTEGDAALVDAAH